VAAIDDLKAIHEIEFQLIIIDTLARSFGGGNENASEDMGAFITAAGAIQGRYECGLLVVHHAGKDATKGLRGHSSLLGAVDTELEIIRIEGAKPPKGILHVSKQKDGVDGQRIGFEMVEVTTESSGVVGFEGTSSLAVKHDPAMDTSLKATKKKDKSGDDTVKLTPTQQSALTLLYALRKEHGTMQTIDGMRNKCVSTNLWHEEFRKIKGKGILPASFNTSWMNVKKALVDSNNVVTNDTWSWIVFDEVEAIDTPNSNVHPLKK
jgi:hypothetical protein